MKKPPIDESLIMATTTAYRDEASLARRNRMEQNKINYDVYHLRQDFSYKQKGQSKEFLPKMHMAVEQATNFIQQGLIDIGEWFNVEPEEGMIEDAMSIKPDEIRRILDRQLRKINFAATVADSTKTGLLGSLMIVKVTTRKVVKPKYVAKTELKNGVFKQKLLKRDDKITQLRIDIVRQEDYYPDPSGGSLYEMQDIYLDYFEVEALAKGPDAIYELEKVKELQNSMSNESTEKTYTKSRETGQNPTTPGYRNRIKITEVWGNLLDASGNLLMENCVWTVANDRIVIQKPTPNPLWHQESPFVACPIIRIPNSVWHKALMDAPAYLNRATNEMFNLVLDGGMMGVHGIKQIREHWLTDPSQIEDGVGPGDTLRVNTSCPPGASALERVDTSSVPPEGLNILNLLNQELNTAALTNDLRMGVAPFRAVKATEVVEASQSISSMFSGMAEQIETNFITKVLEKSWKTLAQSLDDMDSPEMEALIGGKRWHQLKNMTPEEVFASTVGQCVFRVFGISATLNKQREFTKLQAFLQTVASSPVLMEEFVKSGYDFGKLLGEIMKSLDINTFKLKANPTPEASAPPQGVAPAQGTSINAQSQIPQAGAASNQGDLSMDSMVPRTEFPESRATPTGGLVP